MKKLLLLLISVCILTACNKDKIHDVSVVVEGDATYRHVLNAPYVDPGAYGVDYMNKHLPVETDASAVDINHTGTYSVKYTATDEYGNIGTGERAVVVYNELEYLQGIWSFYKYPQGAGTPDTIYIETINVSATQNRYFNFTNFSSYANSAVQAHIEANLITLDSLQYFVGPTENINIQFYGTGIEMNNNRLEITSYGEIINNNTEMFTALISRE
jgi:hypothetical protein